MPLMPIAYTTWPGTLQLTTQTGATTTIGFSNAEVWASWNATGTSTGSSLQLTQLTWAGFNTAYEETREQHLARVEREERQRAELEEANRKLREQVRLANERGTALLLALLSDEQAASRREHGWFGVRGSSSGKTYRIHNSGIAGNVDRLGADGRREMTFCCHPPGLCAPDVHLAQMLALVTDEDEFLRVANARQIHYPAQVPVPADLLERPADYNAAVIAAAA